MIISNNAGEYRTGFQIGHDHAFYGLKLEDNATKEILEGFNSYVGRKKQSTKYIRKWLSVRKNAYIRGIHFCESVSPEAIEKLIDRIGQCCPITGVELTYGTLKDSDWSLERINNDRGYTIPNLTVMSVKANKAKGDYSALDIINIVKSGQEHKGLDTDQWYRIFSILCSHELVNETLANLDVGVLTADNLITGYLEQYVVYSDQDAYSALLDIEGYSKSRSYIKKLHLLEKLIRSKLPEHQDFFTVLQVPKVKKQYSRFLRLIPKAYKNKYEAIRHEVSESLDETVSENNIPRIRQVKGVGPIN